MVYHTLLFFRPLSFGFARYLCCKSSSYVHKDAELQDTELALERRKVYLGFWLLTVHPMVMGCIAVRQNILDWWKR